MTEDELAAEVRKREARNVAIYPKRFYYVYRDLPDGSKKAVEMVTIGKRGTTIPWELNKRWKDLPDIEREAMLPYYEAWKKGETTPVVGTPLEAWMAEPEAVEVLRSVNIRSVEDFVRLEDHNLTKLNISRGRELQTSAKAYLENRKVNSSLADELAELKKQLEARDKDIAELKALLNAPKRGPGRPKKQHEEVAVN